MVVVYKIDRLTRSLADFARLVERLEARGCAFVSVTPAFKTSSMGPLTLNALLSFAQLEREVTAERIHDKIAASRRKGMRMGRTVPLGYDRHPDPMRQELVVNEAEAEQVRALFRLYEELGRVEVEAARLGYRSASIPDRGRTPAVAPALRCSSAKVPWSAAQGTAALSGWPNMLFCETIGSRPPWSREIP